MTKYRVQWQWQQRPPKYVVVDTADRAEMFVADIYYTYALAGLDVGEVRVDVETITTDWEEMV